MSVPDLTAAAPGQRRQPYFFREEYCNLIVKGNFMTLAAVPRNVEKGEWLAHQSEWMLVSTFGGVNALQLLNNTVSWTAWYRSSR
jgi:hypothetical protein